MIVDDDGFDAMAIRSIIESYELSAEVFYNGVDCITELNNRKDNKCGEKCEGYKLIILDCNMPMMNGIECSKRIKQMINSKAIGETLVVGCTAYASEERVKECLMAGMHAVLKKPVKREELLKYMLKAEIL
mmetsp:Transcript_4067/g.3465  ORF Transcript_4067/g.3465 Transcript_4067/m.3465 type:complete len:131 (+) Transcript_4067:278-670(+)